MVNERGQTFSEFVLVFGLLTFLGLLIMYKLVPTGNNQGSIKTVDVNVTKAIAQD